jgi:hypothetical protein
MCNNKHWWRTSRLLATAFPASVQEIHNRRMDSKQNRYSFRLRCVFSAIMCNRQEKEVHKHARITWLILGVQCVVCSFLLLTSTVEQRYYEKIKQVWYYTYVAFEKLRHRSCPSVGTEELGYNWKDFGIIFRKPVEKAQASFKFDKNNRCVTWRPRHVYENISLNSSQD